MLKKYLVRDGELPKVVPDHLRLDLDLVEGLAVVYTNNGSSHLGDNDLILALGGVCHDAGV